MVDIIGDACVGCGACFNVCPEKCILLKKNQEGFLYPFVFSDKCIQCGRCLQSCPCYKDNGEKYYVGCYGIYGVKPVENILQIEYSASAGVVFYLAKYIISLGGVVYGAAFKDEKVIHIRVDEIEDLIKIQNSKYVQSELGIVYSDIKKILASDYKAPILFTGTPCQCAGLKKFLEKKYDNLICLDFICHGVPSPLLFSKYLEWVRDQIKEPIHDFQFRSKIKGWNYNGRMVSYIKANEHYWTSVKDPYMTCFLKGFSYRESCYKCQFNSINKYADITVGDFAGCREMYPDFFDKRGCSVVLINSMSGRQYYELVKNLFESIELSLAEASQYNSNLKVPCHRSEIRDLIYQDIFNLSGKEYVEKKLQCYVKKIDCVMFYFPINLKIAFKNIFVRK